MLLRQATVRSWSDFVLEIWQQRGGLSIGAGPVGLRSTRIKQKGHDRAMRRVSVIGTTGSGKTTLARSLSAALEVPHVELDALYWEPGWTEAEVGVFRQRVARSLSGASWVADGNYSKVRDIVWSRADTVVWLDYPFRVVFTRLAYRTFSRALRREELWSGNRESLRKALLTRDSILLWLLKSYWRRRREYPALLSRPEYAHLRVVRLRSPAAAERWLLGLPRDQRRAEPNNRPATQ